MNINNLNELVSFDRSETISKQFKDKTLQVYPETFGIELEYHILPESDTVDSDEIWNRINSIQDKSVRDEIFWNYERWLEKQRYGENLNFNGYRDDWNDKYGPIEPDLWLEKNPEPTLEDFKDSYSTEEEALEKYKEEYAKWKQEYEYIDYENYKWKKSSEYYSYANEWIKNQHIEILNTLFRLETQHAIDYIKNVIGDDVREGDSGQNYWGIGLDGRLLEIRSKYLTESEIDKVYKILEYVKTKPTSGNTSAHVHIGLPENFNSFDIIAMSGLVDEISIKRDIIGKRNYEMWANLNYKLEDDLIISIEKYIHELVNQQKDISVEELYKLLEKGWTVKINTLNEYIHKYVTRNKGTNIRSFFIHKTIEFRYWSSEAAVKNPHTFVQWIKYFLLLPKIAHKRKKIVIGNKEITLFRNDPNTVKIQIDKKLYKELLTIIFS